MNREEFLLKLDDFDFDSFGKDDIFDNSDVFEVVRFFANKIYDDFEKDLKEINNQVSRLKKQLSKGHHIERSCSFCKPVSCSYVDNNFTFTSCDDCKNKIDGTYQEICSNCKRFYGCYFESKEV